MRRRLAVWAAVFACASASAQPRDLADQLDRVLEPPAGPATTSAESQELFSQVFTVRLLKAKKRIQLRSEAGLRVEAGTDQFALAPGQVTVELIRADPPPMAYCVFAKGFRAGEEDERDAFAKEWLGRGFAPHIVTLGYRWTSKAGRPLDNRVYWVELARFAERDQAEVLQTQLREQDVWSWIRPRVMGRGAGEAMLRPADGAARRVALPLLLNAPGDHAVEVRAARPRGEWTAYPAMLTVDAGPSGRLILEEATTLEAYLAGVVPAEMPALWPMEALKAQAVVARSELLAELATRHLLEGYHFCDEPHCRAYAGRALRHPRTDAAIAATRGQVLADGARILSTVFHANSGGWTANNDTVWSAPPDPALRAVSDLMPEAPATAKKGPALYGIGRWITEPPPSYAGAGERSYRWERRYGARELSRLVNARFPIGPLERIVLGERGPSGRLKWVRLAGAKSTETVFKDYPIREALGGLPSSMFIVDRERGASGEGEYVFRGGGRGHGVGLCQYGAKGRAEGGADYQDILLHYYRNGTLETLE